MTNQVIHQNIMYTSKEYSYQLTQGAYFMERWSKIFKNHFFLSVLLVVMAFFFCEGGCTGGSGGSSTGTLSIGLTDAATTKYEAVYVTIDEVEVHHQNGPWETVATPEKTYDLLELVNGVIENLGVSEVLSGRYTQLRLIIGDEPEGENNEFGYPHLHANYIILKGDSGDQQKELKVPSGPQTGIKLVSPFTVPAGRNTELILDFDADRSVIKAGSSDNWLLKPVIRVLNKANQVTVSGKVSDGSDMNGTSISAQKVDSDANGTNGIQVLGSTVAVDEEGSTNATYTLFTVPGEQNIVAYKDGYAPEVVHINPSAGDDLTRDFQLESTETGYISGNVNATSELFEGDKVVLSFRTNVDDIYIEVKSKKISVASNTDLEWNYNATLPRGVEFKIVGTYFDDDGKVIAEDSRNATTTSTNVDFNF